MSKVTYYQAVPAADRVTNADGRMNIIWLRWAQFIAQMVGKLTVQTQAYDPLSIAAGGSNSVTVAFTGAAAGDEAFATHTSVVTGINILATATNNAVTVTFINNTVNPIDLPSGTLRIGVRKTT